MNRADMLKEAILDGLIQLKAAPRTLEIVSDATFELDDHGRVIAAAPRQRLNPYSAATTPIIMTLREGIEDGLRVHGFGDPIIIEP